jgi:hypothetical protein
VDSVISELFYRTHTVMNFTSSKSVEELSEILRKNTRPIRVSRMFVSAPTWEARACLEGTVGENTFEVRKVIGYRNDLRPTVRGLMRAGPGRTEVVLRESILTRAARALILTLGTVAVLLGAVNGGEVRMPLFMGLVCAILVGMAQWERRRVLADLHRLLEAT